MTLSAGVVQAEVPFASHRLVSQALMETYVRYNKVLAQNPDAMHRSLGFFLSSNGIAHPDKVI